MLWGREVAVTLNVYGHCSFVVYTISVIFIIVTIIIIIINIVIIIITLGALDAIVTDRCN